MRKRTALPILVLATVGTLTLAGPASAATCIPSPGQAFVAPTYGKVQTSPGKDAVADKTETQYRYERVTTDTFKVGEVPPGWTLVGEQRWVKTADAVAEVPEVKETQRSGWVTEKPEGEGWIKYDERTVDATYKTQYQQTRVTQEYQPAVPAEGEEYITEPNPNYVPGYTKHHDAEYATDYLYIKQVKGIWQQQTGWFGWVDTGETFDWENWSGNSTRWESATFTETGPHNSVQSTEGKKCKVSTTYRYVQTGQTRQGAETKAAWDEWIKPVGEPTITFKNPDYVPGKDAVEEQRETLWFDAETVEGWTFTGETQRVKTADAYTEYKYKRTVVTQEHVPGTPEQGYFVQDASYTETTDWTSEAPEGEGWDVIDERAVVIEEGSPAVPAVFDVVLTDAGKPFAPQVVCTAVTPASTPATPAPATANEGDHLATTGMDPVVGLIGASTLLALGGTLVAARARRSRA